VPKFLGSDVSDGLHQDHNQDLHLGVHQDYLQDLHRGFSSRFALGVTSSSVPELLGSVCTRMFTKMCTRFHVANCAKLLGMDVSGCCATGCER
jgi:hypothetical protein